jgi:acetyl coenzyme A synthetase (ADP forming)-like protein
MGPPAMLPLELFDPKSVAVIGASRRPEKVGFGIFSNLLRGGFAGPVHGVNPAGGEILGRPILTSTDDLPPVDLAVFVLPPRAVIDSLPRVARRGLKSAIVVSAGFKETGSEGKALERALLETARGAGVRFLGPNCLGLINAHAGLNASFSAGMPAPGPISFFSQSGALCTAVLDWALGEGVGFSKFVSLGNKADITESDMMEALGADPLTRVILGYVESIDDGLRFLEAARATTDGKPVVMVKAGSTAAGARAASSHTGSLAGSDKAYQAAFRQSGILRAGELQDLYDLALAFAMQPLPAGERLLILTNAGGPGIMAADAAEGAAIPLAVISPSLRARIAPRLPPTASLGNPVDVIGDALADRYGSVLEAVRDDPGTDAVLVLLTPQAMTQPEETARETLRVLEGSGKTALASFLGEKSVRESRRILAAGGIPHYPVPERAVRALGGMLRYRRIRERPPEQAPSLSGIGPEEARGAIAAAAAAGRRTLGEEDGRRIVEAYGFRFPRHAFAATSAEAVDAYERIGGPVAMKIVSPDVLHKTDVGGVRLGLSSAGEVSRAFLEITSSVRRRVPGAWISGVSVQEMVSGGRELIIGMARDPQFGPLLMFGLGGIYVEALKDVSFRLAAGLTPSEARGMIREIRAYPLLAGFRGSDPADEEAIVEVLFRAARLSLDLPEVKELDLNPVVVFPRGKGVKVVDCRMTIGEV